MLLEIKPLGDGLSDNTRSCFDDQIAAIARWVKKDYELMYADSWTFCFSGDSLDNRLVGEKIGIDDLYSFENLRKYHGISISCKREASPDIALAIIREELSHRTPILIRVDPYWVPGNSSYGKRHYSGHLITIVDLDASGQLRFTDAFENQYNVSLPYVDFYNGFESSLYVVNTDSNHPLDFACKEHLEQATESYRATKASTAIRRLASEITGSFSYLAEIPDRETIWRNPICERILFTARHRRQFRTFLEYIHVKLGVDCLKGIPNKFDKLASDWDTVKNLLFKGAFVDENEAVLSRIARALKNLADQEDTLCDEIANVASQL